MSNKPKRYKDLSKALRENLLKRKHQMKERKNAPPQNNFNIRESDSCEETHAKTMNNITQKEEE